MERENNVTISSVSSYYDNKPMPKSETFIFKSNFYITKIKLSSLVTPQWEKQTFFEESMIRTLSQQKQQ